MSILQNYKGKISALQVVLPRTQTATTQQQPPAYIHEKRFVTTICCTQAEIGAPPRFLLACTLPEGPQKSSYMYAAPSPSSSSFASAPLCICPLPVLARLRPVDADRPMSLLASSSKASKSASESFSISSPRRTRSLSSSASDSSSRSAAHAMLVSARLVIFTAHVQRPTLHGPASILNHTGLAECQNLSGNGRLLRRCYFK